MKFAVTGADGFIGSHMVNFLRERGHYVNAITRKEVDLANDFSELAKEIFGMDGVFHFAADMGGVGFFNENNYQPFLNNMSMDINILEACNATGVEKLFYPSSACAYPVDIQANENHIPSLREDQLLPANADQMYGWEKLVMTLLARQSPLDVRVGILNTVFGPGQTWKGDRVKFPPAITYKVLMAKKNKQPIQIWGNGKQTRTFLYIEDALEKIYEVMMAPKYFGEVNIASSEIVTVKQCADWLCEIAGITPNYEFDLTKPSGVLARGIDNTKFNTHYKYRDKFTAWQGFEKLYKWMEKEIYG